MKDMETCLSTKVAFEWYHSLPSFQDLKHLVTKDCIKVLDPVGMQMQYYRGDVVDQIPSGPGIIFDSRGNIRQGIFKKGILIG